MHFDASLILLDILLICWSTRVLEQNHSAQLLLRVRALGDGAPPPPRKADSHHGATVVGRNKRLFAEKEERSGKGERGETEGQDVTRRNATGRRLNPVGE